MSKRAVVLAGGKGSRLRPYTVVLPKPLMPIGDYPILEVILRQLARYGFDRVTLAVNHQAEIVRAFCGDGSKWGISIDYSFETRPLSTIAPLKLLTDLPENFLLLNGDVLTDLDMGRLYEEHIRQRRLFTIAAAERTHVVDYGVLHASGESLLTGFQEKPKFEYLVSMGIYIVNRAVLDQVPSDQKFGFDDLMLDMIARHKSVYVKRYNGYWLDIGRVDDYLLAVEEFEDRRPQLLPDEK
jgi:NDP-sugar pyrophosphorylase family protein